MRHTLQVLLCQLVLIAALGAADTWLSGGPGVLAPAIGLFCGALLGFWGCPLSRATLPGRCLPAAACMGLLAAGLYTWTQPVPAWWAPVAIGGLAALSALVLTLAAGDTLLNLRSKGVAKHEGRWGDPTSYYGDLE